MATYYLISSNLLLWICVVDNNSVLFKHLDIQTTLKHPSGTFSHVCSARSHSKIQHSGDLDIYDLCAADAEKGESLSAEQKYCNAKGMFYHNIRLVEGCADSVDMCPVHMCPHIHNTHCISVYKCLLKREDRQKEGRWSRKRNVKMQ